MNGTMDFTKLTALLERLPERGTPAADCAVTLGGKTVYRHMVGMADLERQIPVTEKTAYFLYSATKVSTCTAVMQLWERGFLKPEDPVSRFLPEFADLTVQTPDGKTPVPAKNVLTIGHLLTMTGGFNYRLDTPQLRRMHELTGGSCPLREAVKALAATPLDFEPGTRYQYSLCHDILGAVIEEVSGVSFGEYLRINLFEPLGMTETGFHPRPELFERVARVYEGYNHADHSWRSVNRVCWCRIGHAYESGGGGLVSTVNDYVKLGTMLAAGGTAPDGTRLLKRETIDEMRRPRLSGRCEEDFRALGKKGYSYGYGVRTMLHPEEDSARSPIGEFGWDGALGAYLLIDPKNELCIFHAQSETGSPWYHEAIRDFVYEAVGL